MAQAGSTTVVAHHKRRAGSLLRVLGVSFGLAVTIGNTIGAGILRTPGEIAQHVPNIWLFIAVWVGGAVYALLCAIPTAEIAATLPRCGGHYAFARYAIGEYAGFFIGWCDWLSNVGAVALISIVIAEYLSMLLPSLAGHSAATACSILVVFSLLQWQGIRWGSGVQQITSAIKAVLFVGIAIAFFAGHHVGSATVNIVAPQMPQGFALLAALALATQSAVYTYDGWQAIIYFGEEVHNPGRDVPRSMFGGVLLVAAIYLAINVAVLHIVPVSQIAGNKLALGEAARLLWGARADSIIQAVTVIAMLSAINAIQLFASRVLFAMSRDGLFVRFGAHVNTGGTPDSALLLSTVVEVAFILTGTFQRVLAAVALFFVINYVMDIVSMIILRRREPNRQRPYRAWGHPYTTGLALVASFAFIAGVVIGDTRNTLYSLVLLAISYPAYRFVKRLGQSPQHSSRSNHEC